LIITSTPSISDWRVPFVGGLQKPIAIRESSTVGRTSKACAGKSLRLEDGTIGMPSTGGRSIARWLKILQAQSCVTHPITYFANGNLRIEYRAATRIFTFANATSRRSIFWIQ
jgi:hypothetical protein